MSRKKPKMLPVEEQTLDDVFSRGDYSGERSPYLEWVERHEGIEPILANPTLVSESQGIFAVQDDPFGDLKLQAMENVIAILSSEQKRLLRMIFGGMSHSEISRLLSCSQQAVTQRFETIRKKITREYARLVECDKKL